MPNDKGDCMYTSHQGTLFSPGPEFLRSYHISYSTIRYSMLTTFTSLGVEHYCRFVMDHNYAQKIKRTPLFGGTDHSTACARACGKIYTTEPQHSETAKSKNSTSMHPS